MERIRLLLHSLLCAAGIFALAAIGIAALSVQKTSRDVDRLVTADNGLKGTIQDLNSDLVPLGTALDALAEEATSQKEYWNESTKKVNALLGNANGAVSDLRVVERQLAQTVADSNRQINGQALPQATEDLKALGTAIGGIQPMLEAIRIQAANPDISGTFAQVKGTTENLNRTTSDIYAMVDAYKRNLEKPKNLAWKIFSALTGIGAKVGQISALAK